ncbi:MAG: hypothetical protein JO322_02010 [Candidatus Eremiobacteraeota bacterium]|nr:hypothetical protein [Candidatus Eremiobacteraeota bacterium]
MRYRLFFLVEAVIGALIALLLTSAVAAQQQPAAQTIVYSATMNGQGGRMGSGGQTIAFTLNVAIKSVDPDGTRHATIAMQAQGMPGVDKAPEDATMTPAGAILPKDTAVGKPHANMTEAESYALAATGIGAMLSMQLRPFNSFAETCAKQKALVAGMSWHADSQIGNAPVDTIYTVKGTEQKAGHNATLVTLQDASSGGAELKGQGYYDPVAHLVVAIHYELHSPNSPESEVFDIGLVNS